LSEREGDRPGEKLGGSPCGELTGKGSTEEKIQAMIRLGKIQERTVKRKGA